MIARHKAQKIKVYCLTKGGKQIHTTRLGNAIYAQKH